MAGNEINMMPQFTDDESASKEVKETATEEVVETEKETPTELPAEEKPAEGELETPKSDDIRETVSELQKAVLGLQTERVALLKDIQELRGEKREIKQAELDKVDEKLDELKDLHPEDVTLVDRILRSKGYITKDQANKMFYKAVEQEELNKFLNKYPEYKPENDPNNSNWNLLQKELSFFRMPDDPHLVTEVLERAHRSIQKVSSGRDVSIKKRQAEVAGVGSGGIQRSSSPKTVLDSKRKLILEQGGWSEEEIKEIENNL